MPNDQVKKLIEKEQRKIDPVNLIIDKQDEILDKVDNIDLKAKELDANPSPIGDFINDFVNNLTRGEKGDKGDKGEPGEPGKTPKAGVDFFTPNDISTVVKRAALEAKPSNQELVSIIQPLIPDPIPGQPGPKGEQGLPGKDGVGINGKDGKDGKNPDPKEVIKELKKLKGNDRLDISNLRNGEQLSSALGKLGKLNMSDQRWHGGGIVTILKDSTQVTNKATSLNFTGSDISSVTDSNGQITIDISGGSGGTVTSVASADGSVTVTNPTTTVDLAVVKAPKLTTARTIAGVSFDGTANISLAASNLSNGVTGSGAVVLANTPTLITPVLGVATATSINGNTISSGTGTLSLSTYTLTAAGTASISGTNTGDQNLFSSIVVSGQTTVTPASTTQALTLVGSGVTITTDNTTKTITLSVSAPGTGTVTNVSSADANATVADPTTTPVITIVSAPKLQTARTIGGVSFDGTANITVSTATGGFTVSGGDLALGANNLTMTGSLGATGARLTKGWFTDLQVTNAISGSITGNAATVTTNANLTGVITSSGNATSIASQTGTGTKFVVDTSPTLVTPVLGVASATSINKLTITTPATGSTLTILDGKTLTVNKTLTLDGTDSTTMTFPSTSATIARTDAAQTFTGTQTFSQIIETANAITASGNAATIPVTSAHNIVTNNSAATLTITLTTTNAVNMQTVIVQILDFSAVAQTISWVNIENSTVSAPTTSNGSTSLPLTVGFIYNSQSSKWRCIASA